MKLTLLEGRARRRSSRSSRAASRRGPPSRSWRDPAARGGRPAAPGRDRHGALAAHLARGAGRGRRRRGRARAGCCVDIARLLPDGEVVARAPRRGGRAPRRVRHGELPPEHVLGRGLPAAAGRRAGAAARGRARRAARHRQPRQPRAVARRVAPGADRHPRPLRGRQDRDGRDRLVPALGEGDGARGRRRPSSRRSCRRGRSPSSARIAQGGDEIQLGVHENQVVFGADGVVAHDAPHRRPVPELQASSCPRRSSTRSRCRARSCSTVVRRVVGDGAAQLAAAAALRGGRARRSRRRRRTSARRASRCRRRSPPSRSRSGFNADFLRDGVESIDSDEITLKLISPLRPGRHRTAARTTPTYLVMPIRLAG